MIVRILAAAWLALTLTSTAAGLRLLLDRTADTRAAALADFLGFTSRLGRPQVITSLVLAAALFHAFFAHTTNNALWPASSAMWVALFLQVLFLRPHLGGYVEIVERGFDRPVARFALVHLTLDILTAFLLARIVLDGVK